MHCEAAAQAVGVPSTNTVYSTKYQILTVACTKYWTVYKVSSTKHDTNVLNIGCSVPLTKYQVSNTVNHVPRFKNLMLCTANAKDWTQCTNYYIEQSVPSIILNTVYKVQSSKHQMYQPGTQLSLHHYYQMWPRGWGWEWIGGFFQDDPRKSYFSACTESL